jgi:hypothetical protein
MNEDLIEVTKLNGAEEGLLLKLIFPQLVKEFPACCRIQWYITLFTGARHWLLPLAT